VFEGLAGHALVDFCKDSAEAFVDVGGIQRGCLQKAEAKLCAHGGALGLRHLALAPEIALVADEHDTHAWVGVFLELLNPALDAFKSGFFRNIVHEQGAKSAPVVGGRNGAVTLLPGCIPYLRAEKHNTNKNNK
jgi:hypothetical protein